jgi:hypothetical protein
MNDLRGKLHVRVNEEETHILSSYSSSFTRTQMRIAGQLFFSSPPTTVCGRLGARDRVRGRMAVDLAQH